jgi:hypothetical protein
VTLVLIFAASRFGHSRALPALSHSCDPETCNNGASSESFLDGSLAPLLSRLDQIHNQELTPSTTHWARQEYPVPLTHGIRAIAPKIEPEPVSPTEPKPVSSGADPNDGTTGSGENASAGLDPTQSGGTSTTPEDNPDAGLDPTKPEASIVPSAGLDPTAPKPTIASNPAADDPNNSAASSDDEGDDVPGQAPDTSADTRSNRPVDDYRVGYDYLAEVVSERGTGLVNDKLANLRNRIASHTPDDPVRSDEIKSEYTFDSKQPLVATDINTPGIPDAFPHEFANVFDAGVDHKNFEKLVQLAGVELTDSGGVREALRSNGATEQCLKVSWSVDQKITFADHSFKEEDNSDMVPKPHFTELTMAVFREKGVDPTSIIALGRTRIINESTQVTIDSIFKSLGLKMNVQEVVLFRTDTDPAKVEAFDAYFRTANGKGTVNLLAFHASDFGFREPQTLVLQRGSSYNTLVTLE